jgi:hypothetical protein
MSVEAEKIHINSISDSISELLEKAESNRFGIMPFLLSIMACMSGFAAASGILESWVQLAAVAFSSTIALAMMLAVASMRVIFITTLIAVIMDVLVLIF